MDKYKNFGELSQVEKDGKDYAIQLRKGSSGFAIMALHGGGIEPGIEDLADSIAGSEHAFYCFNGMKNAGNRDLHISSDRFDEPEAERIAGESDFVIVIHGCNDEEEVIFIGGKALDFNRRIANAMAQAGFKVDLHPKKKLKGAKSTNICNRGRMSRGTQIELSRGIRKRMFEHLIYGVAREKKKEFYDFVEALRSVIADYLTDTIYPQL